MRRWSPVRMVVPRRRRCRDRGAVSHQCCSGPREGTSTIGRTGPIPARADHRPRSVLPIDSPGHGTSVRAGSEGAGSGAQGIEIGHYAALETPWEKTFFFLPLGHSEELAHLEDSGQACRGTRGTGAIRNCARVLEHSASQARGHRDVIARFGRHPHRNAILGRQSTPKELAYLAGGQLVHTRPLPH